ncbi:uncharacterized protein FOMMEDRAFT_160517 [Fomitiporia mediterranea MF3/22]|uniref:uncharacterized protein n=1 Tax=Fomitiporia mediterranea (strain MF3/22) TaxID=694068 RepID=UPI0004408BD1|nr:uncharacterized protein FOMMEDRAFT_160517 [Fomitiporia mediterranea MF3/22]EJC99463.1 hypothetical protein FOMMEDRAFT_160517 [Fomitiporia mediterranea MF3/22]
MTKDSGDAVGKPRYGLADEGSDQFALVLKPVLWFSKLREHIDGVALSPIIAVEIVRIVEFGKEDNLGSTLVIARLRGSGDALSEPKERVDDVAFKQEKVKTLTRTR